MGESENAGGDGLRRAISQALAVGDAERLIVQTPGGRVQVHWGRGRPATAMGQLVFFAEFLQVSGLFDRWVDSCPLQYTSPNAPNKRDVLGSWMLSILDGHRRYAHVSSLYADGVAPQLLGMGKVVSDDSLRRALSRLAPSPKDRDDDAQRAAQVAQLKQARHWIRDALLHSVQDALERPWVLDCDTTIKPLFGHQSGAEVGYNPHKPGRASHAVHTYWVGNLRLVLGAEVMSGKAHASAHSLPGLLALLRELPESRRPRLVRGDCGFGNEAMMRELESLQQPYLFKLRQSKGVKQLIQKQWRGASWTDVGQGWFACADTLKLMGWTAQRRVIVMRRALKRDLAVERRHGLRGQAEVRQGCLQFVGGDTRDIVWEYAVLVSNVGYPLESMGQLYRDRADCENGFDELKNQWGWGGYTTQDLERCTLTAQAVGLIYNWWSWYVRLAHPKARLEAITSRPLLLAAVGRATQHAGQTRMLLTVTHAAVAQVKAAIANVSKGLQHIRATAPQLPARQRWSALVRYILDQIIGAARGEIRVIPALESG